MSVIDRIKEKAKTDVKHIVLAEGSEPLTVQAAQKIVEQGLAKITLVGKKEEIEKVAAETGTDLSGVAIVDPAKWEKSEAYAEKLCELRQKKGMTLEQARDLVYNNTLYFATMMLKMDDADGMVAGAINSTGNVLRPALQIIKMAPGISTASSCFIMELPNPEYGENGVFVYGDCAVVIEPNADELAAIAISTANTCRSLVQAEPRVAMLSFSTKGSAKHDVVTRVQEATAKAKELAPDLMIDGELQVDAALVPEVAQLKAPGSPVAGKNPNVLIFPNLGAGNIGYKLTQRLAGAKGIGPIIQGLAKPVNDLSRGCNVDEIVNTVSAVAVIAQG